ncbi:hypothetical protein K449DRAFT_389536 [Hypoxylon sp. EC38]|nr:hypothetical protein K449DRAFT_389536 [Hypoxylon sp. EC38]
MDPDLDSGLFGIQLSDSEDSTNDTELAEGGQPKKDEENTPADRTAQSEEEFQTVRKEYRVKIEDGEVRTRMCSIDSPRTLTLSTNFIHPWYT